MVQYSIPRVSDKRIPSGTILGRPLTIDNLDLMNQDEGQKVAAVTLEQEVVNKKMRILGENDPNTLTSMGNLAWMFSKMGRTAEAVELEKVARKTLKENSSYTFPNMRNIPWKCCHKCQPHVANEEMDRNFERSTDSHDDTLDTTQSHTVMDSEWQLPESEEQVEESKRKLRENHPCTLSRMKDLAVTYWVAERTAEAASLLEEVVEKSKEVFGEDHTNTLAIMEYIALIYWYQGQHTQLLRLEEELDDMTRSASRENHHHLSLHILLLFQWGYS